MVNSTHINQSIKNNIFNNEPETRLVASNLQKASPYRSSMVSNFTTVLFLDNILIQSPDMKKLSYTSTNLTKSLSNSNKSEFVGVFGM